MYFVRQVLIASFGLIMSHIISTNDCLEQIEQIHKRNIISMQLRFAF